MVVYDIDADTAFELLRLRSRSTRVEVCSLAYQLMTDFVALTPSQRLSLQATCDHLLLTAHERITLQRP